MPFDVVFIISVILEWFCIFILFLYKNVFTNPNFNSNTYRFAKSITNFTFGILLLIKIGQLILLVFPLNQLFLRKEITLHLMVYSLWQLLMISLIFYFLLQLNLSKNFQERFAVFLSRKAFAGLIFIAIWDLSGNILIYFLLSRYYFLNPYQLKRMTIEFLNPSWQTLILIGVIVLILAGILSYFMLKKEVNKMHLSIAGLSYLLLILFGLFTFYNYHYLILVDFENLFNQFYLFLVVLFWLIIFTISTISYLEMVHLYFRKKYLKSGFQFHYLFYHFAKLHLISATALALMISIPVIFFIYFRF